MNCLCQFEHDKSDTKETETFDKDEIWFSLCMHNLRRGRNGEPPREDKIKLYWVLKANIEWVSDLCYMTSLIVAFNLNPQNF